MDSRLDYAEISKRVLKDHFNFYQRLGFSAIRPLFDDVQQSYMLLDIGWYGKKYIHNATIHLEVINGKVWVQHDDTEAGVALKLLEHGVPREDIVLGFQPPEMRQYTEFAVA
jgi:hypothetical protein